MDVIAYVLLAGAVVFGLVLLTLVIAGMSGANERGNDDHELEESAGGD